MYFAVFVCHRRAYDSKKRIIAGTYRRPDYETAETVVVAVLNIFSYGGGPLNFSS